MTTPKDDMSGTTVPTVSGTTSSKPSSIGTKATDSIRSPQPPDLINVEVVMRRHGERLKRRDAMIAEDKSLALRTFNDAVFNGDNERTGIRRPPVETVAAAAPSVNGRVKTVTGADHPDKINVEAVLAEFDNKARDRRMSTQERADFKELRRAIEEGKGSKGEKTPSPRGRG